MSLNFKFRKQSHPLHHLEYKFWPNVGLLLNEALDIRNNPDTEFGTYKRKNLDKDTSNVESGTLNVNIKTIRQSEKTPHFNQMVDNFFERYGDFGKTYHGYMIIEPEYTYNWHVDTFVHNEAMGNRPILCAMNLICTNCDVAAEFQGFGEIPYKAAIFNTDHPHRVKTANEVRIIARIGFQDMLYEEVVHKIKKIDKQR